MYWASVKGTSIKCNLYLCPDWTKETGQQYSNCILKKSACQYLKEKKNPELIKVTYQVLKIMLDF